MNLTTLLGPTSPMATMMPQTAFLVETRAFCPHTPRHSGAVRLGVVRRRIRALGLGIACVPQLAWELAKHCVNLCNNPSSIWLSRRGVHFLMVDEKAETVDARYERWLRDESVMMTRTTTCA